MRRMLVSLIASGALVIAVAAPAAAHNAPPCNDSNGDGAPSGAEYAMHHISALAREGALGNDGHKPGSHRGFSLCLGVH